MNITTNYESKLILKKLEVLNSRFDNNAKEGDELELKVLFDRKITELGDNQYNITLTTIVSDDDKKLFVSVTISGLFETEIENKVLVERNTIAIMFPFVRSYISLITTQPNKPPIILPAINVAAMINDNE